MDYVLRKQITVEDVDFLNSTTIQFDLVNPYIDPDKHDSGWCDAATGARLVTDTDRVVFRDVSDEELTLLTLKFQDRIKPRYRDDDDIYNIDRI